MVLILCCSTRMCYSREYTYCFNLQYVFTSIYKSLSKYYLGGHLNETGCTKNGMFFGAFCTRKMTMVHPKNILVYCHFLNYCKEKMKHIGIQRCWQYAPLYGAFLCCKKHKIPIAQAMPKWCITEKVQYPNWAWLGLSVFPVKFDCNFLEQCELLSKLSIAKRIIKRGAFFMKRPSLQHL